MRLFKSIQCAWNGLKICFQTERNYRIQFRITGIAFLSGIVFGINKFEWIIILLCSSLVMGLEMVNTAIEKLSDIVTTSIDPAIKKVKDIAAGAVLLVSVSSVIAGLVIFLPKIEVFIENIFK
ncbi:MAG: diacylglycerol kinase family protein [Ginsengibacter sp.]